MELHQILLLMKFPRQDATYLTITSCYYYPFNGDVYIGLRLMVIFRVYTFHYGGQLLAQAEVNDYFMSVRASESWEGEAHIKPICVGKFGLHINWKKFTLISSIEKGLECLENAILFTLVVSIGSECYECLSGLNGRILAISRVSEGCTMYYGTQNIIL